MRLHAETSTNTEQSLPNGNMTSTISEVTDGPAVSDTPKVTEAPSTPELAESSEVSENPEDPEDPEQEFICLMCKGNVHLKMTVLVLPQCT